MTASAPTADAVMGIAEGPVRTHHPDGAFVF